MAPRRGSPARQFRLKDTVGTSGPLAYLYAAARERLRDHLDGTYNDDAAARTGGD
jgi:hypothetical protein